MQDKPEQPRTTKRDNWSLAPMINNHPPVDPQSDSLAGKKMTKDQITETSDLIKQILKATDSTKTPDH